MIPAQSAYLLATFATFGVLGAPLFSFGVGIAFERAQGWFHAASGHPGAVDRPVVISKWFGAALFAALIVLMMSVLAAVFGEVRMATAQWFGLLGVLVAGTLPFCLLGLALGLLLSPNAAPAVINILYLPLAFLSGLWVPVSQFPGWLQGFAEWLPPFHLAALVLHVTGVREANIGLHAGILAFFSIGFGLLVVLGWRRLLANP